jgi:hypothetical protein
MVIQTKKSASATGGETEAYKFCVLRAGSIRQTDNPDHCHLFRF